MSGEGRGIKQFLDRFSWKIDGRNSAIDDAYNGRSTERDADNLAWQKRLIGRIGKNTGVMTEELGRDNFVIEGGGHFFIITDIGGGA